jgi:lactoylglutathione lyase
MRVMESKNGIILFVDKLNDCIRFYRDKVGLAIIMEKPGIVRFSFGSMYLQLEDSDKFSVPPSKGIILRENVASISAKRKEFMEKGMELEIHDLEWGEIGFAFDPHGNKVEYFREK